MGNYTGKHKNLHSHVIQTSRGISLTNSDGVRKIMHCQEPDINGKLHSLHS
jgi:hypothetical protein